MIYCCLLLKTVSCVGKLETNSPFLGLAHSKYTLTGHFIRYALLVPGWILFFLQNCIHFFVHRFNKVLETSLRGVWSI